MKVGNPNVPWRNSSGYLDPTAYEAIMAIQASEENSVTVEEYDRFRKLIKSIKSICDLAGFEVSERIVLTDKNNGRVWK